MVANATRMSGGSGVERARRSCSPLDPLVGRSEAEASQRILDPPAIGAPPQRSANGGHNRRGEAVFELMSWLSADAGKSKQIIAVPTFYASPEPCLFDGPLDHRFMYDNSVCPYLLPIYTTVRLLREPSS